MVGRSKMFMDNFVPLVLGNEVDVEDGLEVVIENIKIRGAAARTLERAAVARGVHVKQVLADIIHYVLEDDMVDAVLDDR